MLSRVVMFIVSFRAIEINFIKIFETATFHRCVAQSKLNILKIFMK